jgi:hypothetical protein
VKERERESERERRRIREARKSKKELLRYIQSKQIFIIIIIAV